MIQKNLRTTKCDLEVCLKPISHRVHMLKGRTCWIIYQLWTILRCIMRHLATGYSLRTGLKASFGTRTKNNFLPIIDSAGTRQRIASSGREFQSPTYLSASSVFPIYYNDVYHVPLPKNHRFPMEKYGQVRQLVQAELQPYSSDTVLRPDFRISPIVSVNDLETTHCPNYIERFLLGKQTIAEQRNVGFPWSPASVQRALSSTGGTVAAARDAIQLGIWACHVAGGTHHAFYDRGEGFCVFSDMAVAANVVLRDYHHALSSHKMQHPRILILDLDVHQGNGNAVLFRDNPQVVTFSIHCVGNYFSEKQTSDLDIELPIDCTDQTYLATLHHWLQRIQREMGAFDLIFFQAGVDIHQDDRLGRMAITTEGILKRNELVFHFMANTPAVICMGGGYPAKDDWSTIMSAHASVYTGAYHFARKQKLLHQLQKGNEKQSTFPGG